MRKKDGEIVDIANTPLSLTAKSVTLLPVSNRSDIDRKRSLFMKILKDEFLRELNYLWEVANGRAVPRDTVVTQILQPLISVARAIPVPWVGAVVQTFNIVAGFAANRVRNQRIAVVASLKTELDIPRLSVLLDTVAREALRRYESFIIDRLSDDLEMGVVPFAKAGARRMIEYISHHRVVDVSTGGITLTLNEATLLAGLIEGQSGAWIEGFSNHVLQLKKTQMDSLARSKPKTVDAEDVYARAGFRQFEIKDGRLVDILYSRAQPKHHELPEWKKFQATVKGKIRPFGDFGYVRFSKQDGIFVQNPEVGYVLMPLQVIRDRYDFSVQDAKVLSPLLLAELKASSHSMIQVDRATIAQYISWEKTKKDSGLIDYVRDVLHYPLVQQVICGDDLSGLPFAGLNLSHSDLSGAILSGDLTLTNLSHSYLVGTVFQGVTSAHKISLNNSHCEYLSAEGVDFQGGDLTQTNFEYASLKGINLIGCKMLGARWEFADLTNVRSDVDVLREQSQQMQGLQKELLAQRQEFQTMTALLQGQIETLQKTAQQLATQLEQQESAPFKTLSTQVQTLLQHQENRLTLEVEYQKELSRLRERLAQGGNAQEIKQLQTELQKTEQELKYLQTGTALRATMSQFKADFQQQSQGLDEELKASLIALAFRVDQDCQAAFADQSKRLSHLEQEFSELGAVLAQRLTKLEGRVDVVEQWIQNTEVILVQQQTEKEEAKQTLRELKAAMHSLRQELQKDREDRQLQEQKITEMRRKINGAADAKQVRQLQLELQALQEQSVTGGKPPQQPPQLQKALQARQLEIKRQKEVTERAAVNATVRQKLQPKITQLTEQEQQWIRIINDLNLNWTEHVSAQEDALAHLREVFNETNAACEQRILRLEADVGQLKSWAQQTQARLNDFEKEEGDTRLQVKALQEEMSRWVEQQQKYQAELDALRATSPQSAEKSKAEQRLHALAGELQSEAKENPVSQKLRAIHSLYSGQQADLEAAIALDEGLRASLESDQAEISEKIKILAEIAENFQHKQEGALQKFQGEVQAAIAALSLRVDGVAKEVKAIEHRIDISDPRYTVAVRLKTLRLKVLEDKYITRELDYYIAPNGQNFPGSEASTPLMEWVRSNFLNNSVQTLLLQGPGGAGKSTFNRYLLRDLWNDSAWEQFQPGQAAPKAYVPFFVPLGSNRVDPGRLFDYLRHLPELIEDFTDAEINILKSDYRILWIADGYDEMPGNIKLNLYARNGIDEYQGRAKLLISRRSDPPLTGLEEKTYFIPSAHTPMKPLYQSYYVAPFTEAQTKAYIDQYLAKKREKLKQATQSPSEDEPSHGGILLWDSSTKYLQHFKQIAGIEQLINTPFLLMITIETLPTIVLEIEREHARSPQKSKTVTADSKMELTRKKLLAGFVDNWFNRQAVQKALPAGEFLQDPRGFLGDDAVDEVEAKLQRADDIQICLLKMGYLMFCQDFAKHLQAEKRVVVQYPPLEAKRESRFQGGASSPPSRSEPPSWINELFDPKDHDMRCCRRGSPLKTQSLNQGKIEYGFLHALLIDYFVSTILDQQAQKMASSSTPSPAPKSTSVTLSSGPSLLANSAGRGKPPLLKPPFLSPFN